MSLIMQIPNIRLKNLLESSKKFSLLDKKLQNSYLSRIMALGTVEQSALADFIEKEIEKEKLFESNEQEKNEKIKAYYAEIKEISVLASKRAQSKVEAQSKNQDTKDLDRLMNDLGAI